MERCNHSEHIQNNVVCGQDARITAAAGWCAPSEMIYSLGDDYAVDWANSAWPRVPRGGLRYPAITQEVADILTGRAAGRLDIPEHMLRRDTDPHYGPDRE